MKKEDAMPKKPELTAEAVIAIIEEQKPATVTALARALGYSGSVSSWLKSKLVELVPDLMERIGRNKVGAGEAKPAAPKSRPTKKASTKGYARAEHNPFREGSAYATAYDVLAAHPDAVERSTLVSETARVTGKDLRKAYFDVTVVASSRKDGRSHRCIAKAADGYFVERTNGGWLKLVLRDRKF
ncbi:hypothetical protein ACFLSJ_00970 [Verrucomicrobiota bacterium]